MGLRTRLTLLAAGVVGITVVLASVVCYLAMRGELRAQVDEALGSPGRARAAGARRGDRPRRPRRSLQRARPGAVAARPAAPRPMSRSSTRRASMQRRVDTGLPEIPVTARDRRVAAGKAKALPRPTARWTATTCASTRVDAMGGGAFQLGRSLAGVDSTLSSLRWVLIALCVAGTALAAALGRLFSRPVMQPVTDLTDAAEHITATEDLARRVDVRGDDEVGRMAARFNTMLDTLEGSRAALDDSVEAQRRLVADASHELRTPVTSLRTNVEVLLAGHDLPESARRRLLEDVREQTEELSALITDVIELARGEVPLSGVEDVRLDDLVRDTVARVERHHPGTAFRCTLEPSVVEGAPGPARPGGGQPARQRRQVRTCGRRGRGGGARRARSRSATSGPACRRRRRRSCSTASTAARGRGGVPARGSGWRSCGRWPRRTGARWGGGCRGGWGGVSAAAAVGGRGGCRRTAH